MYKASLFIPSANTDGTLGSARDFVRHRVYRSDSRKDEIPCPVGTSFPVCERRREAHTCMCRSTEGEGVRQMLGT